MKQARVLFVDDEVSVLRSLKRGLRLRRRDWIIQFHESPVAALEGLEEFAPWIVVSDKRMAEMDGLDFLYHVKERLPEAVRVLLSGDTSGETALGSAEVAHILLAKPFDLDDLIDILERTYCLYSLPVSAEVRQWLGQVKSLPVLPEVYQRLVDYLNSTDEPEANQVARIISQDAAILSKILQVSNSSFFGFSSPAKNAQEAVIRLGMDLIKQMVLCAGLFDNSDTQEQAHRDVAAASERIAGRMLSLAEFSQLPRPMLDKVYITGLLHNVGALLPQSEGQGLASVIGAYLLRLWGFDDDLVEAVMYQNDLSIDVEDGSLLLSLLRVALIMDRAATSDADLTTLLGQLSQTDLEQSKVQGYLQQN